MRRYSPSSTEKWDRCPMLRKLSRDYISKRIGKRDLSAILGKAFHAGVAAYNVDRHVSNSNPTSLYVDIAIAESRMELARLRDLGARIGERDMAQANALEGRISKIVTKYVENDPIPASWPILDVERILPEWGPCIIDLGLEHPMGPVVLDYKVKTEAGKWLEQDKADYGESEQRFHYSVAYGDYLARPVYGFTICLVIVEPTVRIYLLDPFVNDPRVLDRWRRVREGATWKLMEMEERGEIPVGMSPRHRDQFGPCPMKQICLEYDFDEDLITTDYIKGGRE
jgi:PD-(D/E)XK nuclease superfamily protein